MPGDTQEGSRVETAHGLSRRTPDRINAFFKISLPILIPLITLYAGQVASSIQSKISGATLLSQREQAESSLRADMFKSLIAPIFGPQKDKALPPDNERLLVELLALNFHENFELKPLFERVDRRLASEGIKEMGAKRAQEARRSLRSIARRIIDRQIAALRKAKQGSTPEGSEACTYAKSSMLKYYLPWIWGTPEGPGACTYKLIITEKPKNTDQCDYLLGQFLPVEEMATKQPNNARWCDDLTEVQKEVFVKRRVYVLNDGSSTDYIQPLTSPDKQQKLAMVVTDPKWDRQEFTVELYDMSLEHPHMVTRITATWADLPLTDNTLFSDGNRFAVVIYSVDDDAVLKNAILKVIWFPRNYFTPRERPLDYGEFLKLVGKKTE